MKLRKIFLFILVFIFILSFLLWSIPIFGAEKTSFNNYQLENFHFSDDNVKNISEVKILPDSKIFFLKLSGEQLKRIFLFNRVNKLKYDIKLANYRIIEVRELLLKNENIELEEFNFEENELLILNSLKRFRKKIEKVNNNFLSLISQKPTQISDENISEILTSSYISWQKILSEISYFSGYNSEISLSSIKIYDFINSKIPFLVIKDKGIEKFISLLEKYFFNNSGNMNNFNNSFELLKDVRNLEIFNGIDFDIFSNKKIWELKNKLVGNVLGEIFSAKQIYQDDFIKEINLFPFLNDLTKKEIFLDLKNMSGFEEYFSQILKLLKIDSDNQLAEGCFNKMILKTESNLKKLNNEIENINFSLLSSTLNTLNNIEKKETLNIFSEQIKGYILSSKREKELNNVENSCLLLKQANILYHISNSFSFYHNNENEISEIIKNSENELKKYEELEEKYIQYIRIKDIINQLKLNLEGIKEFSSKKDILRVLQQKIVFYSWQRNLEIALNIIDSDKEEKILFNKEKNNQFNIWCWNERGIISESFSLLPNCLLLDNQSISLNEYFSGE